MKIKFLPQYGLLLSLGLVGCRPAGRNDCSSSQAVLSDSRLVQSLEPKAPAGGYVQIDGKACTATFMLTSASHNELTLDAFTPHHCVREDGAQIPRLSISVYVPSGNGYIKNIPVKDDFFERKKAFLNGVKGLNIPMATEVAEQITDIPQMTEAFYPKTESASASWGLTYCTDKGNFSPSAGGQVNCWSTQDAGVRRLKISSADVGVTKFKRLKSYLENRKSAQQAASGERGAVFNEHSKWVSWIHSTQGANRMRRYSWLAGYLNKKVCQSLPSGDPHLPLCSVRSNLVNLAQKFLVETDVDGKSKNVLEKLNSIGAGIDDMNAGRDLLPEISSYTGQQVKSLLKGLVMEKLNEQLEKVMNDRTVALKNLFRVSGGRLPALPKSVNLASNAVVTDPISKKKRPMFGLIQSSALFGDQAEGLQAIPIPDKGDGALFLTLPKDRSKIKFSGTDSGSMITLSGFIPLLVLHTVDGVPVSGGASILALPSDDEGLSQSVANVQTRPSSVPVASRASAVHTGAEMSDSASLIAANEGAPFCN